MLPFQFLPETVHPRKTEKLEFEEKPNSVIILRPYTTAILVGRVHNYKLLSQLFSLVKTTPLPQPSQATVSHQSSCMTNMLDSNDDILSKLSCCTCWNEMCSLRVKSYFYTPIEVYTGAISASEQDLFVAEGSISRPVSGSGSSL